MLPALTYLQMLSLSGANLGMVEARCLEKEVV